MSANTPENRARVDIDRLLTQAGWAIQDRDEIDLFAERGVAVREYPLTTGPADYLLFVDQKVVGVIEAKKQGQTLSGYELQSERYSAGLPPQLKAPHKPLPFLYVSTGTETWFTCNFDPVPRSRRAFAFHQPEMLAEWLSEGKQGLRWRFAHAYPQLNEQGLWRAQIEAIRNLEASLGEGRDRALIQMATGSGKTHTAVSYVYRMFKFARVRRVLFLVDRNNLARQTLAEFQNYTTPDDGRKFTDLYNVQHLTTNALDDVSNVVITTIQRLYSMLRGEAEFDAVEEETGLYAVDPPMTARPKEVSYNPRIPIEYFDIIITDEAHRSIYNVWRQVLEYFDAFLIGMTATPGKQTFGFFKENLVMEYTREQAIIDGVNVPGEAYAIRTQITQQGSQVDAGYYIPKRDRKTRAMRMELLDQDFAYSGSQLDLQVVSESQIRTVIRTFREKLFTDIFPDRDGQHIPKTLIFAKDDSHAEDIVRIVREEFNQANQFCQKITYKVDGKPDELISAFRNTYYPRIAVTVDMIATGTDVKSIEVLMFMRLVKSAGLYEQMQGRGVRVINNSDLTSVTPDASKDRFVIVDAVGVVETEKAETVTMERLPTAAFGKLLDDLAVGDTRDDVLITLAGRITRLSRKLTEADRKAISAASGAKSVSEIAHLLHAATNPDEHRARAAAMTGNVEPTVDDIAAAEDAMKSEVMRLLSPKLRNLLKEIHGRDEVLIDDISRDRVLFAGYDSTDTAQAAVTSFRDFIEQHRDEIAALRILYNIPYKTQRLEWAHITELAERLKQPPLNLTPERLWAAYAKVEPDKVRMGSTKRLLTDLVVLVRHALQPESELIPYPEQVQVRYRKWLDDQYQVGSVFTPAQRSWLDAIAEQIAVNLTLAPRDFNDAFHDQGGWNAAVAAFGNAAALRAVLDTLNDELAA
jgi:type I restriction enzyme R subunit